MAESVECFNIPIPCHVLHSLESKMTGEEEFGLKYKFDKDSPLQGDEKVLKIFFVSHCQIIFAQVVYKVHVKDPALDDELMRQLEGNNTELLDTMMMNISDTLINRDKSARLRMLWEDLTFNSYERNSTSFGDCTQV